MEQILIVGIGNPLRGDDAVGWTAIDTLLQYPLNSNIEAIKVQQLTLDLVDAMETIDRIIFIDARLGQISGELQHRQIAANTCLDAGVSHFFDPGTLLAAVQALYGHHPIAELYTINADSFEYGADLTPSVQTSLDKLVTRLRGVLSPQS